MSARRTNPPKTAENAMLATLSEQVAALSRQIAELTELVRAQTPPRRAPAAPPSRPVSSSDLETNGAATVINPNPFAHLLLLTLEMLRGGRQAPGVPIVDVRKAFAERGFSREEFDARLLDAERASIVELKGPSDPALLEDLEASILDDARGPLQFVVAR